MQEGRAEIYLVGRRGIPSTKLTCDGGTWPDRGHVKNVIWAGEGVDLLDFLADAKHRWRNPTKYKTYESMPKKGV